jgi:hypothetical protein
MKKVSSPTVMKSEFKVQESESKAKGKQQVKQKHKKEAAPDRVLDLITSVMRLEQKVDSIMDEVEVLKKRDTTKEPENQVVVKPKRCDDDKDDEFQSRKEQ